MYNEDEALKYIRQNIDPAVAEAYDDDELLNVVDMIWDYYEQNGMLDVDCDDDDAPEDSPEQLLDALVDYSARMLRKDRNALMKPEHLRPIIAAELDYENSLL